VFRRMHTRMHPTKTFIEVNAVSPTTSLAMVPFLCPYPGIAASKRAVHIQSPGPNGVNPRAGLRSAADWSKIYFRALARVAENHYNKETQA
jgi:hypothetical protein